jgi:RNase P/RNase MRP subunit POP5
MTVHIEREISKKHEWIYLKIFLEFESATEIDELVAKSILQNAVYQNWGVYGTGSVRIDILKLVGSTVYFRTNFDLKEMVLSSLPLVTQYSGKRCRVRIECQSPFLVSVL